MKHDYFSKKRSGLFSLEPLSLTGNGLKPGVSSPKILMKITYIFVSVLTIVSLFIVSIFVMIALSGCGEEHLCLEVNDQQGGAVTTTVGVTKHAELYELGIILIQYENKIPKWSGNPELYSDVVNDFFVAKGYTPKVIGSFWSRRLEVVDIGRDVSPIPLLKGLNRISHVKNADLNFFHKTSTLLFTDRFLYDDIPDALRKTSKLRKGLIEVGNRNGLLYELGVVLVQYEERVREEWEIREWSSSGIVGNPTPVSVVNDFFIAKGYTPETIGIFADLEIIEIAECVDPASEVENLKALSGVFDVHFNTLYSNATRLSEGVDLPIVRW